MASSISSSSAGDTAPPQASAPRLQQLTRERNDFGGIEAALGGSSMAAVEGEGGSLTERLKNTALRTARLLAAYLGNVARAAGPATPVTADDVVWMLDNVAFPKGGAGEENENENETTMAAEFTVAVFSPCASQKVVDAVQAVAAKLRERRGREEPEPDDEAKEALLRTIESRVTPFLLELRPGRQVAAVYGKKGWRLAFAPAGREGLAGVVKALPPAGEGSSVVTRALAPPGTDGLLEMTTLATAAHGWAVISDIDDTIKVTQTSDPVGILQTTFVDEPVPIAGMPELYAFLREALSAQTAPPPFFYLSASPYNLYPFLRAFRRRHYPDGMLLLRDAAVNNVAGLLKTLTLKTQEYKVGRMQTVHGWLPGKAVVCIGDSTQSDPEAYGEIYRTYPGWVRLILIRKVTDIAAVGMPAKNEPARFEAAFEGVPRTAWHVFEDPAECYPLVKALLATA